MLGDRTLLVAIVSSAASLSMLLSNEISFDRDDEIFLFFSGVDDGDKLVSAVKEQM